jgi:hypothetical protein
LILLDERDRSQASGSGTQGRGAQRGLDRPLRAKIAQSLHFALLLPIRFTAEIRSQSFGSPPTDRERRLQQASTANHITQLDATQWMQIPGPSACCDLATFEQKTSSAI